jgi:hypothetical protein
MMIQCATMAREFSGLEGMRHFLLSELELTSDPASRSALREYISDFNRKVRTHGRPELRIELAGLPTPRRSPAPAPYRSAPPTPWSPPARSAAMAEDPIIKKLYQLWAEFRATLYKGRLPVVVIATDRRDDNRLGSFHPKKAKVWLNPGIIDGSHPSVRGGSRDQVGLLRFAGDVLLHESIHAHEADFLGRCNGHNGTFHAECVRLARLLNPQRRSALERLNIFNCEHFPSMCRPKSYYRDAVTPGHLCRG